MCVNFRDLNKTFLKDAYFLLRIDQLVEHTFSHELLTFMDAYSSYNQIKMAKGIIVKTFLC